MKLWTIRYHLDDTASGTVAEYFTSKSAAWKRLGELGREYPADEHGERPYGFITYTEAPEPANVPTTRDALCAWLNAYAVAQ